MYDKQYYNTSYIATLFYLSPFIALWIFIVGGQFYVGTDYITYLGIFNNTDALDYYFDKGEICFVGIISIAHFLGFKGQSLFFIFAFLSVILYISISKKVTIRQHAIFFFLFVTVSTLFHNQMNTISQCIAIYFVTLAILELLNDKRILFFVYIIIAMGFHLSSIGILLIYPLKNITLTSTRAKYLLFAVTALSFISFDSIIRMMLSSIPQYSHYLESEYLEQSISLSNKMTKLCLFPIYYFSTSILSEDFTLLKKRMLHFGLVSYMIKTLCLVSPVTNRFGQFFFIISVLPIFYYIIELKSKSSIIGLFICAFILFLYCVKVLLLPTAEYTYMSIFSTYF